MGLWFGMKKYYELSKEEFLKKDGKGWVIFGSIWTVVGIGVFIIFPILIQAKDLAVCLILGAFLVLIGPAFLLCGVQKLNQAKKLAALPDETKVKKPNAVLFGVDDGSAADVATNHYCKKYGKAREELTDEDESIIWDWAYDEISYLLAWIFENGYYNPDYTEPDLAELEEKIAKREAIPSDYMNYDASVFDGNIKDEVFDFVCEYLDNSQYIKGHHVAASGMIIGAYFAEVEAFAKEHLNAPLLGFSFTWEDYDAFKGHIEEAYAKYKSK